MTAIVGIRCKDGVVIGADSSATFSDGGTMRTIEQPTNKKIEVIEDHVIIAGTGQVGHMQRFAALVRQQFAAKAYRDKSDIEIGKTISSGALQDFHQTHTTHQIQFTALVAYVANNQPVLCELAGMGVMFQPEIKKVDDLWFTSAGSGQLITDPFLALFRKVFWTDGAPSLEGGIFTALWALQHACEVNPGGIKEPIKIAVLAREDGKLRARLLDESELAEHGNMVAEATRHMASFRDILEGRTKVSDVPMPKA